MNKLTCSPTIVTSRCLAKKRDRNQSKTPERSQTIPKCDPSDFKIAENVRVLGRADSAADPMR